MRVLRWLAGLFAWRAVRVTQSWRYEENAVTGDRRAVYRGGGYSDCDFRWLHAASGGAEVIGWYSRFSVKPARRA